MIDREKVIKKLAVRIQSDNEEWNMIELPIEEANDILALLKEQDAVKPYLRAGGWYCGRLGCKTLLGAGGTEREDNKTKEYARFCRKCGRAVKWE